jgi:hypothetical protein
LLELRNDTGGDSECESKPGDEEGSCDVGNDVKLCRRNEPEDGIEALVGVPEVVQRPRDRPTGPQGSIGAGEGDDDGLSGEGDEASAVCEV